VILLLLGGGLLLGYFRGGRAWPVLAGGVLALEMGLIELLVRYAGGTGLIVSALLAGVGLLTVAVGTGLFSGARSGHGQ